MVIATYNYGHAVGNAIDSVLAQTRPADEIVVCDDGSTDDTAAVLARYGDRITVIHQANAGVSVARNAALGRVRSDFIILLDADDTWLPERIRCLEDHLIAHPELDIVTADAWLTRDGRPTGSTVYMGWPFANERQEVEILRGDFIHYSAAVRVQPLLAVGGWDVTRSFQCEYDGWINMILAGSRAGLVRLPLGVHDHHAGSLSTRLEATWMGDLELLRSTARRWPLNGEQRSALREHERLLVRRLRTAKAKQAIRDLAPGVRRTCLVGCLVPGQPLLTRVKLLAAALLPGPAHRRQDAWAGRPYGEM